MLCTYLSIAVLVCDPRESPKHYRRSMYCSTWNLRADTTQKTPNSAIFHTRRIKRGLKQLGRAPPAQTYPSLPTPPQPYTAVQSYPTPNSQHQPNPTQHYLSQPSSMPIPTDPTTIQPNKTQLYSAVQSCPPLYYPTPISQHQPHPALPKPTQSNPTHLQPSEAPPFPPNNHIQPCPT